VAVHGLPTLLPRRAAPRLVRELAQALDEAGKLPDAAELLDHVVHSMACRRSVMAGDELSPEEIDGCSRPPRARPRPDLSARAADARALHRRRSGARVSTGR
jgi:DNA mismatch repair ATPase MutL